jgi:macrolide-specific efflux system membrane fusion protein
MKKAIKWIVVLAVLAGAGYWVYSSKIKKTESDKPTYDRAKAELRDLRTTVESTGEVQPRNRLDVKPPIAGRLEQLMVDEGDKVEKGQILGWVSSTERATLLDAALATSKEELAYWEDLYKPSPLVSPLKGTIIARNFEPGQSINANDAVVVIADDLIIVASLDETDIGQVKLDQAVEVRLESYPDRPFDCVVEKIAYDARNVQNVTMYEVDVRPENLPRVARSGMTANLEFIIEEKTGALVVPAAAVVQGTSSKSRGGSRGETGGAPDPERRERMLARMRENGMSEAEIQERLAQFAAGGGRSGGEGGEKRSGGKSGGGSYVLVDSGNPLEPEQKNVRTGISDGSYTEILEGLEEGDEVLIRKIKISSGSSSGGSNPLMPRFGGRSSSSSGGGGRR